jgi:hypothetical protein
MPLEIRELVIRVTVEEPERLAAADEKTLADIKHAVIRECIEEVLLKLENRSIR